MGKDKTKNQKKLRAAAVHNAEEEFSSVPHSFVFHRGQIGKSVQQLIVDVRRAMDPFTAASLKVRKKNSLKDFVAVAGPLGVTHFLIFSKTESNVNFKFVRLPKGPTLHFKVTEYSLVKDVISSLKKHRMHEQQFTHPPLLVLNNFGTQGMHVKLMATMFQNMFPSINVHKVNLNTIRRCILINYNEDTQSLDFRHYSLKVVPVGMSKGVKKLLQEKFPNMSRWEDISELLVKMRKYQSDVERDMERSSQSRQRGGANLSESEAEQDGDHNITELPQAYAGRGNMKSQQSAVRLTEIGPRLTLHLVKIEEGLGDGKVLYHNFVRKTEEEIAAMLDRKEKKLKLKQERKQKQEQNVKKKQQQKEDSKKRTLAGMKRKRGEGDDEDSEVEDPGEQEPGQVSEDDDAEYYRQQVGEEPDRDLFLHKGKQRSFSGKKSGPPMKKFKGSKGPNKHGENSASQAGQHKAKFSLHKKSKGPNNHGESPASQARQQKGKFLHKKSKGPNKHGENSAFQSGQHKAKFSLHKKSKGPKGQSPQPGKKGQRFHKGPGGERTHKNPAAHGNKKTSKRQGAFGSKGPKTGKQAKTGPRHKMGGPKGRAFRQKKK